MINDRVLSPLSLKNTGTKVDTFPVDLICQKYREYGVDVSSYFEGVKQVELFECTDTGYRFYSPFTTIGDAEFYENLSTNKTNYYSNRWEHKIALSKLSKNNSVLEVGSGFGAFLNLLKENGISAKGLELNPHAVKECKVKGFNVEEKLVQTEALENSGKYDAVCFFQVLEHITEVNDFIKASVNLLKVGGKLIVGVPNNNPYLFINDKYHTLNIPPHHAGLWNKKALTSLENIFNLKVEYMEFEPLQVSYNYFIKHQIKAVDSAFLRKLLKAMHRYAPEILRKICCTFIKGRNVLVVYKKV